MPDEITDYTLTVLYDNVKVYVGTERNLTCVANKKYGDWLNFRSSEPRQQFYILFFNGWDNPGLEDVRWDMQEEPYVPPKPLQTQQDDETNSTLMAAVMGGVALLLIALCYSIKNTNQEESTAEQQQDTVSATSGDKATQNQADHPADDTQGVEEE